MKAKSLIELIEYLDETQEVLDKATCFCAYDAKQAMDVAWECVRRLQAIAAAATGDDLEDT